MKISIIVAMAINRVIGKNNRLPWRLPADLKHFKQTTMGKPILMGRKTWESIGRALPGRTSIVMTRDADFTAPGCVVVNTIESALRATAQHDEIMVIGGAELYRQVLPLAGTIYMTLIHEEIDGDTFFPELEGDEWLEVERADFEPDEDNPYEYSFIILERVRGRE